MTERKGTRALELWCKRLIKHCPDVHIENMTTSWRNGMAFCALVHHFRPDLIDMTKLNPENIYENNQLAFSVAEKHLGIPSLLDPEDMVENEVPDRLSILTYLSQFYQRLGHTVNTRINSESDSATSPLPTSSTSSKDSNVSMKFGKADMDKCVACGLPVYLAQKLIVSHKLYHRRCFRCTKCLGHLNPNSFNNNTTAEFICDNCKNDGKLQPKTNEAQMGMLAFNDSDDDHKPIPITKSAVMKETKRPLSISEKISMFEKSTEREELDSKLHRLSLKETSLNKKASNESSPFRDENQEKEDVFDKASQEIIPNGKDEIDREQFSDEQKSIPETLYKSDSKKFSFLQTQLEDTSDLNNKTKVVEDENSEKILDNKEVNFDTKSVDNSLNMSDDNRIANKDNLDEKTCDSNIDSSIISTESEVPISIPPRRKKRVSIEIKEPSKIIEENNSHSLKEITEYPDYLNPFSDDDDDTEKSANSAPEKKRVSTNPFGSSDEDEDDELQTSNAMSSTTSKQQNESSQKRHIVATNPFWSDGEEPTTDEDSHDKSSMYNTSIASSTPNLRHSTPRHKKSRAPLPPPLAVAAAGDVRATSTDDVASISSMSSYSTVHSDKHGKLTPRMQMKRFAPTPPDSISTVSECSHNAAGSMLDIAGACRRTKRPAPGLPLPARRAVRPALPPAELQLQLDLLDTQQLGLERQGVLIEQMIRDKCERDDAADVPQEEVEDLVIQLCELVNEKNDLFRKQTELMYIRRQQRLEQEQADIEHEIRVIQSQPAVNRIDADKAREEQLVGRLVATVRLRDELVQQMEAERRRERQEDIAIATSIASKRAQRSSCSNSSTMTSEVQVAASPKKNKVKDKMKKQFKKAKHSLIPKKKEEVSGEKSEKAEKGKKSKT